MDITYFVEALRLVPSERFTPSQLSCNDFFRNQILLFTKNFKDIRDNLLYGCKPFWTLPIPSVSNALTFDRIHYPIFLSDKEDINDLYDLIDSDDSLKLLCKSNFMNITCHDYLQITAENESNFYSSCYREIRLDEQKIEWHDGLLTREICNAIVHAKQNNSSIFFSPNHHTLDFWEIWPPTRLEQIEQYDHPVFSHIFAERHLESRYLLSKKLLIIAVPTLDNTSFAPMKMLENVIELRDELEEERVAFSRYINRLALAVRWELPEEERLKDVQDLADEKGELYVKWSTKLNRIARRFSTPLKWLKLGIALGKADLQTGVETGQNLIAGQADGVNIPDMAFAFIDKVKGKIESWKEE